MTIQVYTLWAALKEDPGAFWMVAAEDEFAWEGDPERCDAKFKAAQDEAEGQGFIVREVWIEVDSSALDPAFHPTKIKGEAKPHGEAA